MEKPVETAEDDIATQPYRGPGAIVTGAGEGAIAHYGTGFIGLVVGAAASFAGYKTVNKWEEGLRRFNETNAGNRNPILRGSAYALNKMSEWSHHAGQYLNKASFLKNVSPQKMDAMIFGGGVAGLFGFVVAPVLFLFTGAKHANDGKNQFREAQREILTVRAERDALREQVTQANGEIETLRGQDGAPLKVAKDTPPAMDAPHHGTAGVHADSPNVITPPKIEAPVIGTSLPQAPKIESPTIQSPTVQSPTIQQPTIQSPTIQGPTIQSPPVQSPIPRDQWWDGKEQGASHAERLASRSAEAAHEPARV